MSVVTPRDPVSSARMPQRPPIVTRAATFATAFARVDAALASCAGPVHDLNEDGHSALDGRSPVFVVADGVGGGAMASCASRELVARVHASLDGAGATADGVRDALIEADRAIARTIAAHTDACGAATVALCAGVDAAFSEWLVAWVGDCRVYRLRDDADAELLTVDDTYRHLGETPPPGASLDDPARMVGNGAVGAPNVRHVKLRCGDLLVLVSDGVHKHARPYDIAREMRSPATLAERCQRLVTLARANGGVDDATALAVCRRDANRKEITTP